MQSYKSKQAVWWSLGALLAVLAVIAVSVFGPDRRQPEEGEATIQDDTDPTARDALRTPD